MFNILERHLSRSLGPFGLIAVGLVAGLLAEPAFRKGMRRFAVKSTAGMLTVTDAIHGVTQDAGKRVQATSEAAKEGLRDVVGEARNTNKAIFEEAREEHAQDLSGLEATESAVKEDITAVDSKDSTIKGRSRTTRKKVAAKVKLDNGEQ
jgi:uncharacterized membrane protein